MYDDFANPWTIRLKWGYLLLVVVALLSPVFYTVYIFLQRTRVRRPHLRFHIRLVPDCAGRHIAGGVAGMDVLSSGDGGCSNHSDGPVVSQILQTLEPQGRLCGFDAVTAVRTRRHYGLELAGVLQKPVRCFHLARRAAGGRLVQRLVRSGLFDRADRPDYLYPPLCLHRHPDHHVALSQPTNRGGARACGATAWQAFWQVEFPQIRVGVFSSCAFVTILSFNEAVRTALLKGGFDTFSNVLVAQMLNIGMSGESYAMAGIMSIVSIFVIGSVIVYTLIRSERLDRKARAAAEPVMSS